MDARFGNELSAAVWRRKYRRAAASAPAREEASIAETWQRVARAVAAGDGAAADGADRADGADGADAARGGMASVWAERYLAILDGFQFLPAGRILAGAGTGGGATLFSCFVQDTLEDSIGVVFDRLKETALTMAEGGGVGCDFSPLGPPETARRTGSIGAVASLGLWNAMCSALLDTAARRGAMIATLDCDHPEIEAFIDAKQRPGALTNFNLSVQVDDDFLARLARGDLRATGLWRKLTAAAHASGEPGILLVDRINRRNNLHYRERITTTNPCGEVPLPPSGACNLGSINLAVCVVDPFGAGARIDLERVASIATQATRFLDNVIGISDYPLPKQAAEARGTRRIGLGITGLADALVLLGLDYGSDAARALASEVMRVVRDAAYRTSIDLAREKGPFPYFEPEAYLDGAYVAELPAELRDGIARHGIRNSHLLAIAPAGSISLVANNISSGIEPIYAAVVERGVREPGGELSRHRVPDYAYWRWQETTGARGGSQGTASLPKGFVTALELDAEAHLLMQAALQPLVDNSIAKTVNVREDAPVETIARVYARAIELGLNGCTVFRSNPVTGAVLDSAAPACAPGAIC